MHDKTCWNSTYEVVCLKNGTLGSIAEYATAHGLLCKVFKQLSKVLKHANMFKIHKLHFNLPHRARTAFLYYPFWSKVFL